jgi:O-6-methylguanine DNA methyltransferase
MINLYVKNIGNVWFGVAFEGEKIFGTWFGDNEKRAVQELSASVPSGVKCQRLDKGTAFAERVVKALKDVYDGKDVSEKFSFATEPLSAFAGNVLKACAAIPLGYVSSYGAISKVAGGSPRGVGRVMAKNPFAPIVPCHRVVGSDFSLVGYGGGTGGVGAKLAFLKREKKGYASKQEVAVGSKKLEVFPVEFVLRKAKS